MDGVVQVVDRVGSDTIGRLRVDGTVTVTLLRRPTHARWIGSEFRGVLILQLVLLMLLRMRMLAIKDRGTAHFSPSRVVLL